MGPSQVWWAPKPVTDPPERNPGYAPGEYWNDDRQDHEKEHAFAYTYSIFNFVSSLLKRRINSKLRCNNLVICYRYIY